MRDGFDAPPMSGTEGALCGKGSRGWASPVVAAFGLILAGVGLRVAGPGLLRLAPPCAFHELTGLHCPGCGSTRALSYLALGDPLAAVRSNPFLLLTAPFLVLALLERRTNPPAHPRLRRVLGHPAVVWGFIVAATLFGILRNLPVQPFVRLAP